MTFTKQIKRTEQETGAAEAVARAKTAEQRPAEVAIRIQDLRLWINKQGIRKRSLVHILHGVSANFEPGKLNVIMGPSGTTLPSAL
jgi:ABC-type glutathione transport system ATPase component